MDHGPPSSSVHGILQARILEWVAIPFSRESSPPRDQTQVSCLAGRFFTIWAPREAPYDPEEVPNAPTRAVISGGPEWAGCNPVSLGKVKPTIQSIWPLLSFSPVEGTLLCSSGNSEMRKVFGWFYCRESVGVKRLVIPTCVSHCSSFPSIPLIGNVYCWLLGCWCPC